MARPKVYFKHREAEPSVTIVLSGVFVIVADMKVKVTDISS